MMGNIKNIGRILWENSKARIAIVILLITMVGLLIVPNYGLSVDEGTEISMVRRNLEWITNKTPIPKDLKYFGIAFNALAETVFQAKEFVGNGFSFKSLNYTNQLNNEDLKTKGIKNRVEVKHYVTFIFSGITYLAVAGIVGIFCGAEYAWFGALSLAIMPIHWGHSFFNPKDTPFAAMFTISSLMGAYIVNYYFQEDRKVKLGNNQATRYTILYGILLGLSSGVRIGAFLILFFLLATYLVIWWEKGGNRKSLINFSGLYLLMGGVWAIVHSLCYPGFWENPLAGFFETISYLSSHPLQITVLFQGEDFPIQKLPRTYLLTWIFMSIPLIFHLGFISGSTWILVKYKQLSILQKSCIILLWWQVLFLPLLAIVKHSAIYDGMRHFLFITPGMVAITAVAIVWLYQALNKLNYKRFLVGLVIVTYLGIVAEMISLHPYEYIYINRLSGGIQTTPQRFDLEILGLSLREGMEWINQNATTTSRVVVGGIDGSAGFYADAKFKVVPYEKSSDQLIKPFYYLSWIRWQNQNHLPKCPIVHQVTRQSVTLAIVRECK